MSTPVEQSSPYAPIRFRSEIWWRIADRYAKARDVLANGMVRESFKEQFTNDVLNPWIDSAKSAYKDHPDRDAMQVYSVAQAVELQYWIPLASQFLLNGKQIFDMDQALMEQLMLTDLGDSTLRDWNPVYDCFYLRLGKQEGAALPFLDGAQQHLEGAFIAVTPYDVPGEVSGNRIKIGMTTVKDDGTPTEWPAFFLDILPKEQSLPIVDCFDAAISRRIANFSGQQQDPSVVGGLMAGINRLRAELARESGDLMKGAMQLVVNALFYIETMGKDVGIKGPGRDIPTSLAEQWESTPNRRHKLEQALTRDGYSIVRHVGREFAQGRPTGSGTVSTHWRRGHYRDQPYGPQKSLVKRVWIKPTIIAAEQADSSSTPGHIYKAARPR